MNSISECDRSFPLTGNSTERTIWHAPRLFSEIKATPGVVMGNRAFMRAWAARRAAKLQRLHGDNAASTERRSPMASPGLVDVPIVTKQPDGAPGSAL